MLSLGPTWQRRAALAIVAVLGGLVVHNSVVAVLNEDGARVPPRERPHVSPRDIEMVATDNRHGKVHGRLSNFYYLQQRIAGKRIIVPSRFERFRWELERVARLEVVVSDAPLLVAPAAERALRKRADVRRRWYLDKIAGKHTYQRLFIDFDRQATAYVLADTENGRALFLLPEERFRAVVAPPDVRPPDLGPARSDEEDTP